MCIKTCVSLLVRLTDTLQWKWKWQWKNDQI